MSIDACLRVYAQFEVVWKYMDYRGGSREGDARVVPPRIIGLSVIVNTFISEGGSG